MDNQNCFLCAPNERLLITSKRNVFAMAGLGPLTPTYAMIAARIHAPSLADLALTYPQAIEEIVELRQELESARGPLLMTEHGRVPICRDEDQHESHCFHAHALLFDVQGKGISRAGSYYGRAEHFSDLKNGLEYAAHQEAYLLVSESPASCAILSEPLNTPRQLARTLVALAVDDPSGADWRIQPRLEEAEAMAQELRGLFETGAEK